MIRTTALATAALALAFATAASAANKDTAGYTAERAALATGLPVHIVALNTKVRPQMGFRYVDVSSATPQIYGPGISPGQAIGAGIAGGLIASAIINGAMYAQAKDRARTAFTPIRQAGCDLRIDAPLQQAVGDALKRSAWGASATPILTATDDAGLAKMVPKDQPRQVFAIGASLSPELTGLITTVDVSAYTPDAGESSWQKKPAWRDQLIVVSDWLDLPVKTQADIDGMVEAEQARYQASGADALIKKVNAQGGSANRADRKIAVDAMKLHKKNMDDARMPSWSPDTERLRRAGLWSENDCRRMHVAVDQAVGEVGRLLDALYAQQLPKRLGLKDNDETAEPLGRHIQSLPGGVYVSRADGGSITLGFRDDLLPMED